VRPVGWSIERVTGPAQELHEASAEMAGRATSRVVRILEASRPAVVLGSSQPDAHVNASAAAAAGVDVVRRRSGGGAVLATTPSILWVDLIVPAGDPLWDDDVGKASWWVGDLWADAVAGAVGAAPAEVWKSAMKKTQWSTMVCFAGVGPGEVLVGGRKVVGISQRRTRSACLFQTAAALEWDARPLLELLSLEGAAKREAEHDLRFAATGLGRDAREPLVDSLVEALPR
jgi:lipoate---protein ligase